MYGENKTRIDLTDSITSAVAKLSEGNIGAVSVCAQLLKEAEAIDPDAAMGALGALLGLDSIGIYGSRIWILFKDRCGMNVPKMLAVLRAWQLGFISDTAIRAALDDRSDSSLDVDGLYAAVKKELPAFDPNGIGADAGKVGI